MHISLFCSIWVQMKLKTMRSALLCSYTILTHSSTFHGTLMVQHKAQCDAPIVKDCFHPTVLPLPNHWPWNLEPRMESLLWYLRLSPYMPKHFPFWMSKVNKNVAVSPADHDSSLSCFDFCLHHLQARCFKPEYCGFIFLFKTKASNMQVYLRMTQYSNLVYAWIIV